MKLFKKKEPFRYYLLERGEKLFLISPDKRVVKKFGNNNLGRPAAEEMRDELNDMLDIERELGR